MFPISDIPRDVLALVGNFNATASSPYGTFKSVTGPVTADSLNDNGTQLLTGKTLISQNGSVINSERER